MVTRIKGRELVEAASTVAETVDYRGFTIEVHELTDEKTAFRFMPVILKDGQIVRHIFVRSKTACVSMNHFAKRAIDHFVKTRNWPAKQGLTVRPATEGA